MNSVTFRRTTIAAWLLAVVIAIMSISCGSSNPCPESGGYIIKPGSVKAKLQPVFYGYSSGSWLNAPKSTPIIEYIDPMYNVGDIFAPEGDENGRFYRIIMKDSILTK